MNPQYTNTQTTNLSSRDKIRTVGNHDNC